MTKRKLVFSGGLLSLFVLLGWLFLGVYTEREFNDHRLFVKHKPTLKFTFHAPLGESDKSLNELNPQQSHEEVMYREYVEERGGSRRSIPLGW